MQPADLLSALRELAPGVAATADETDRANAQIRIDHARSRLDNTELVARGVAAETTRWGLVEATCPLEDRAPHRALCLPPTMVM
jgi:hypothetical protein